MTATTSKLKGCLERGRGMELHFSMLLWMNWFWYKQRGVILFSSIYRIALMDHALAEVNGFVYTCGGSVEGKSSLLFQDHVYCFNTSFNHWDQVAPLQEERARLSAVAHEGLLYAVGMTHLIQICNLSWWILAKNVDSSFDPFFLPAFFPSSRPFR